ncbi:MAG: ABC transporter ATP-binding protein [Phycisphaerales bacterium]
MRVTVNNLRKTFGKTEAVSDLSFSFETGQIFAFVGPNGAGKTTTMRILATLDTPDEGDCFFDGLNIIHYPEQARRMIGYMPDNLPTHRDLSVQDYLDFFARAYGLRGRRRRMMIEQIQSFTNLTGIKGKMLKALSKGMKQRVSLARALIHDPPLLIMDEPAAGLDPRARVELRELMRSSPTRARRSSARTSSPSWPRCPTAVIIERGRLLRAGTMTQIYNHGREDLEPYQHVAIRTRADNEQLHRARLTGDAPRPNAPASPATTSRSRSRR